MQPTAGEPPRHGRDGGRRGTRGPPAPPHVNFLFHDWNRTGSLLAAGRAAFAGTAGAGAVADALATAGFAAAAAVPGGTGAAEARGHDDRNKGRGNEGRAEQRDLHEKTFLKGMCEKTEVDVGRGRINSATPPTGSAPVVAECHGPPPTGPRVRSVAR